MNAATWILLGEFCVVTGALIVVGLVYEWRKKKRLVAALELLLTNLQGAEVERKKTLTGRLKNGYQIDEARAEEMSDEIFRSERQFIQKVVKLLMSMDRGAISNFNEDVYALLSPYWELLPVDRVADTLEPENTVAIPAGGSADKEDNETECDLEITLDTPVEEAQDIEPQTQNDELDGDEEDNADISKTQVDEITSIEEQADPIDHSEIDLEESSRTDQSSIEHFDESEAELTSEIAASEESRADAADDSEEFDSFVANIVEDEYIATEVNGSGESEETGESGDEPSLDDATDETEQQSKIYNLDEIEVSDDPIQSASE